MSWRASIRIVAVLALFLALGIGLDPFHAPGVIRRAPRGLMVPRRILDAGTLGRILRGGGFVEEGSRDERGSEGGGSGSEVWCAHPGGRPWPSSRGLAAPYLREGWPLISIAVDEGDLHDPVRGIVTNWKERWERPAHVSYYEGKTCVFTARCGIRLHGGSSRNPEIQKANGVTWRSYRLYFREEYGAKRFEPGSRLHPEGGPWTRLIVRGNSPLHCALGFDVVRRVGGLAPAMWPAIFVLNGERQGMFSLVEQVHRDTWALRLGHEDFSFFRYRGPNTAEDRRDYLALYAWVQGLPEGGVTKATVERRVDVENLTRHLFAAMWCGVHDWMQGAAILDRRSPEPRWSWITWDMDAAFRPMPNAPQGERPWEKDSLDLVLRQPLDLRAILFRGMLRDDPMYHAFFADLAFDLMNHRLDREFFEERRTYYGRYRGRQGIQDRRWKRCAEFFRMRNDVVREQIRFALGLGAIHPCVVRTPIGMVLDIDGYAEEGSYTGRYFEGQEVCLRGAPGGWRVNGRRMPRGELRLAVRGPLRVEALE